ncbi:MAG TPA: hypothetical protein DC054_01125 [Blastocatellia bacterium]|nr:hypothetical protein [Blastocatellia bacterium]
MQRLARGAPDAVLEVTNAPKQINKAAIRLKQKFDLFILSISSVFRRTNNRDVVIAGFETSPAQVRRGLR